MMYATIYRTEQDGSNGGVSSKYWKMEVVEPNELSTYKPLNPNEVLVLIKRHERRGKRAYYLTPLNGWMDGVKPSFGGNYAKLDDKTCRYPIPIYDRYEK